MKKRVSMDKKRADFASMLANLVAKNKPIIYFDETTFHSHVVQKKSWSA